MTHVRERVDRVLGWVLVLLMAGALVNVLWQVFTRWALGSPSSYTEELARYLLVWIGLLGAAFVSGRGKHLAIDLLPETLTGRRRAVLGLGIDGCVFVFALLVMVVGGGRLVQLTWRFNQLSAALGLPLGVVYLVIPLSGLIVMFYAALRMKEYRLVLGTGPAAQDRGVGA